MLRATLVLMAAALRPDEAWAFMPMGRALVAPGHALTNVQRTSPVYAASEPTKEDLNELVDKLQKVTGPFRDDPVAKLGLGTSTHGRAATAGGPPSARISPLFPFRPHPPTHPTPPRARRRHTPTGNDFETK